ncbi:hypothetical protein ABKN59_003720 [Abortiporus biennis]
MPFNSLPKILQYHTLNHVYTMKESYPPQYEAFRVSEPFSANSWK